MRKTMLVAGAMLSGALLSACQASPTVMDEWGKRWRPAAEEACKQEGLTPGTNEFGDCVAIGARRQAALVWCAGNPATAQYFSNDICAPEPMLHGVPLKYVKGVAQQ